MIKISIKGQPILGGNFDFLYCADLCDYLEDKICKRLNVLFLRSAASRGLVTVTNVSSACHGLAFMELIMDWKLISRAPAEMSAMAPEGAKDVRVFEDVAKGNVFLNYRE